MFSFREISSPSSVFAAYASLSAFIMLFKTAFSQLVPQELQKYIINIVRYYLRPKTSTITLVVEQNDGITRNQIYNAAEVYLCSKMSPDTERVKVFKNPKEKNLSIKFAGCEKIVDYFEGIDLKWRFICEETQQSTRVADNDFNKFSLVSEKRYFELTFDKKYKEKILNSYVPFLLHKAKIIKDEKKTVKLHTLAHSIGYSGSVVWDSINLEHPFTFGTLAMDPSRKNEIIEDLDRFVERKDFYRKVGKAWKRGYLLYGPPGTGKSSLIAAMANYLKFDIYDLQLMNIRNDSDWRKLLLSTANRSILVIEDIDCSVELPDRKFTHPNGSPRDLQFSLSGLLNFIDGLWSSCGDERIIIFTTNNKGRLDPALLRAGRMDKHIYMPHLTMEGFKILASNYLDLHVHHPRFNEIEMLIESTKVTPAEVAEELMKSNDVDVSLQALADFLKQNKIKCTENNAEETEGTNVHEEKLQISSESEITLEKTQHLMSLSMIS